MRGWLRLQLALSAVALAVVLVRSAQIVRMSGTPGTVVLWKPVIATQAAFWIAWSLWAGALVPLVRRLVERPPSRWRAVVSLVALAILPPLFVPLLYAPVHWLTFQGNASFHQAWGHMASHDVLTNVLLSATIVGVVYGWLSLQRGQRLAMQASVLREQLAQAQLDTLRAQLNPHFLFNALNSVAVLARRGNTDAVERMVTRLGDLLRHSLESSRAQLVPLRVELEALRAYLEVEQVRHGERLAVSIDVPDALLDGAVPSFLLQPLVENAIRHGFSDASHVLHVGVSARRRDGTLALVVEDDGAGFGAREARADGLGLGNTRSRLEGLYGSRASIAIGPSAAGTGTTVTVTIPA